MARPKKEDARDIVYKVRLNEEEDRMLSDASEWTSQAKSEVFRKALLDYYKAVKVSKHIADSEMEAAGWSFDHISQQRILTCPYVDCGDDFAVDFSYYSEDQDSEGLWLGGCTDAQTGRLRKSRQLREGTGGKGRRFQAGAGRKSASSGSA